MHFQGKKAATNGKLNATISGNTLTNVSTGLEIDNPHVLFLNITNNIITTITNLEYAVNNNTYYNLDGTIIRNWDNVYNGLISTPFQTYL